jgi:hypothetical protein
LEKGNQPELLQREFRFFKSNTTMDYLMVDAVPSFANAPFFTLPLRSMVS